MGQEFHPTKENASWFGYKTAQKTQPLYSLAMATLRTQLQNKLNETNMTPMEFLNEIATNDEDTLQEFTKNMLVDYFECLPQEEVASRMNQINETKKETKKRKREEEEKEKPASRPKLTHVDLNDGENVVYYIKAGIISKWWGDYIPEGLKEEPRWQSASDFDVLDTPENAKLLKELTYRWNRVVKGGGTEQMYDIISYCRHEESGVELCISFHRVKYSL
jgi:hypothetical protein